MSEVEDQSEPMTAEGARRVLLLLGFAEAWGVVLLAAAALYYSDMRTILLVAAGVYACVAIGVIVWMRGQLARQVESAQRAKLEG